MAILWLSNEFSILNSISCDYEGNADTECISHEIKLDLFRISQEALANILYYAEATLVRIRINMQNDCICLSIYDNGPGFQMQARGESAAMREIRERVASIDGQLTIRSEPGEGTTISVCIYPPTR